MHKNMGYFNGWKFGVPIIVISEGIRIYKKHEVRLVHECDDYFIALIKDTTRRCYSMQYSSVLYKYIPIPYKVDIMQPRFPVCSNRRSLSYCNVGGRMARLDAVSSEADVIEVKELRGAK